MKGEYQVGALGDFIAKKSINKKDENVTAESRNIDSPFHKELEKNKKRKSKKKSPIGSKKLKKDEELSNLLQNDSKNTDQNLSVIETSEVSKTNALKNSLVNTRKKKKLEKVKKDEELSSVQQNDSKNIDQNLSIIETSEDSKPNALKNSLVNTRKKKKLEKIKKTNIKESEDYVEKESRTIFVGNVPVNVKMSAIKALFKQFGEIETTRLRSVAVKNLDVPKRVSIMKGDFHPLRDTANVYIRFKTIEQAQKSLVLNATQFNGHKIRVDMAMNSNHKQNKKKGIFIGNLPYNVQEDEIWNFFNDCGVITAVRVVRDNMTGVSKGFGYVDFETKESVELALQLQGNKLQNRIIRIKRIDTHSNVKTPTKNASTKSPFPKKFKTPNKSQSFQGETLKSKSKKKPKPTKTDLMRKKIAKKLAT